MKDMTLLARNIRTKTTAGGAITHIVEMYKCDNCDAIHRVDITTVGTKRKYSARIVDADEFNFFLESDRTIKSYTIMDEAERDEREDEIRRMSVGRYVQSGMTHDKALESTHTHGWNSWCFNVMCECYDDVAVHQSISEWIDEEVKGETK